MSAYQPMTAECLPIEVQIRWLEEKHALDKKRFQQLMQCNRMKPHTAEYESRMTRAVLHSLHELHRRTAIAFSKSDLTTSKP